MLVYTDLKNEKKNYNDNIDDDNDDVYLNKLQQEVLRNVFSTQIM
jgi:hypothetical protein